jgi:hypothetical protein
MIALGVEMPPAQEIQGKATVYGLTCSETAIASVAWVSMPWKTVGPTQDTSHGMLCETSLKRSIRTKNDAILSHCIIFGTQSRS